MEKQEGLSSPIFLKYLKAYEANPRSRVFAPLAEYYRKAGMLDKAMIISKEGIANHPTYTMGYLALAYCYYEQGEDELAYATIRPLIETNRDNLRLQKLFAEVCSRLRHFDEAMETYKYLLFINPKDAEVAEKIREMEKQSPDQAIITPGQGKAEPQLFTAEDKTFDVDKLTASDESSSMDIDDWQQVDLTGESAAAPDGVIDESLRNGGKIAEEVESQAETEEIEHETPVITHTLVDLYCTQGHVGKAIEILEKILELNPSDQDTIQKLEKVKQLVPEEVLNGEGLPQQSDDKAIPVDEGRKNLMDSFDIRLGKKQDDISQKDIVSLVEKKFWQFHTALKERSALIKEV